MAGFPLSFLRLLSSLKLPYFSLFVNFYYVFLRCLGTRFWGGLVRGFGVFWCAVLGRFGVRFWGGLVRGFGAVGCAVLGRFGAWFWGVLVRGFDFFYIFCVRTTRFCFCI